MGHAATAITAQIYIHNLRKNTGLVNLLDTPQPPATQTQPVAQNAGFLGEFKQESQTALLRS